MVLFLNGLQPFGNSIAGILLLYKTMLTYVFKRTVLGDLCKKTSDT